MKYFILSIVFLLSFNVSAKDAPKGHKEHKEHMEHKEHKEHKEHMEHKETGEGHTADVCSATDPKVCAHIGHMKGMLSKMDSSFKVHVMGEKAISNFTMDLWMPEHGHGTNSPVVITKDKGNKYDVTKAVFSMPGKWVARLSFDIDKTNHKIEIPLTIEK